MTPRMRITIEVDVASPFHRKAWQTQLMSKLPLIINGQIVLVQTEEVYVPDTLTDLRRKPE